MREEQTNCYLIDVLQEQSVTEIVRYTPEVFPNIDILVNAAGLAIRKLPLPFQLMSGSRLWISIPEGHFFAARQCDE